MTYTCPKCGKKIDLSTEVLISSDYKVVCPQCLCNLHIIGDYAYIPSDTLELDTTVEPSRTINCPNCGHEASTGAHFCPNCGASFDSPARTSPPIVDADVQDVTVLPPPLPDSDPLYQDAVQYLMTCTSITPMMLRDHFNISNERASQLIRQLEAGGVVGPYNNGGPRQILIPHRGFNEQRDAMTGTPRRSGTGCWIYFIILVLILFIARSCG